MGQQRKTVPDEPRRETPSEQLDRLLADPDEYFRLAWEKAYADARAERETNMNRRKEQRRCLKK